jgi:bifunctional ADP-heptose synthase (sugar kinase/adenylyltransferase)
LKETQDTHQRKSLKVFVVGDSCFDSYHYGSVNRISPEAPIPIFDYRHTEIKMGMSHNVLENVLNLGHEASHLTHISEGKNRYIDERLNQQVIRIDHVLGRERVKFGSSVLKKLQESDLLLISDYNKGFLKYEDIESFIKMFNGPTFIDTKKTDLKRFKGAFIKINESEWNARISDHENVIVTKGANGVQWKEKQYNTPKATVYDVCGAGDTFLAALATEYVLTDGDMSEAIHFAMRAAAVTISKFGVYAPTMEEINNAT